MFARCSTFVHSTKTVLKTFSFFAEKTKPKRRGNKAATCRGGCVDKLVVSLNWEGLREPALPGPLCSTPSRLVPTFSQTLVFSSLVPPSPSLPSGSTRVFLTSLFASGWLSSLKFTPTSFEHPQVIPLESAPLSYLALFRPYLVTHVATLSLSESRVPRLTALLSSSLPPPRSAPFKFPSFFRRHEQKSSKPD